MCGKTGECKGEMTWVWGKGRWKGITGTTPFVAGIYIQEQKEGEIYGSAHWPTLTYTLPWGFKPHGERIGSGTSYEREVHPAG